MDVTAGIPRAKIPCRSPEILNGSEAARLLAATDSPKYRAVFTLADGAGLRVSSRNGPKTRQRCRDPVVFNKRLRQFRDWRMLCMG